MRTRRGLRFLKPPRVVADITLATGTRRVSVASDKRKGSPQVQAAIHSLKARKDSEEGFTLIELMVVVLIIAILIAIAIPTFLGARERAQDRAAQSDLRNALVAAKTFYTDNETYTGLLTGTPTAIESIEPSLDYGAAASKTVVGVTGMSDTAVNLAKQSKSNEWFAICEDLGAGTEYGRSGTDAAAAIAACTTEW